MPFNILSISDSIVESIYSPMITALCPNVDFVLACGDLPYYYIEYVVSHLNVPVFFVRGNHDKEREYTSNGPIKGPGGAFNLHRRVVNHRGLLLAGVEGSLRYREGPFMYSQQEMWLHVMALVPALLYNQIRYRRYLDIFITHAAPWGIHDQEDLPHHGIYAFRWLLQTFHPAYHFHGHTHLIGAQNRNTTLFQRTQVINTSPYRLLTIDPVIIR